MGEVSKENRPQWQINNKGAIKVLVQAKAEAFKHGTREEYKKRRNRVKTEMKKMLNRW